MYEEACLDDLHREYSIGAGSYGLPFGFRYLMKVWRDLARVGKGKTPSASTSIVRVSLNAWVQYFYNRPFYFQDSFAEDDKPLDQYYQLLLNLPEHKRYLCAPLNVGWSPRKLLDKTYLATYLVYWLATFVVPYEEEGVVHPKLIYPACLFANGRKLTLAPAA